MVDVTAWYSPKHFRLKALRNYWVFALLTEGFCTLGRSWNPGIYTQIYLRSPCHTVLIGSNKQQRRGRIISNLTKQTFSSRMPSAIWVNLTMQPPSCTLQNRLSSPLQFGQEENISGHSSENRAYWFVLKIARVFFISTGLL